MFNATLDDKVTTAFHSNTLTNNEGDTTLSTWMGTTLGWLSSRGPPRKTRLLASARRRLQEDKAALLVAHDDVRPAVAGDDVLETVAGDLNPVG